MNQYDLSAQLKEVLSSYSKEVTEQVTNIVKDEAEKLVENISKDSPKRHKKVGSRKLNRYAKGWVAYKVTENQLSVEYVIHNKTDYQLTHLLENGHANRDGSRTEGISHIKPNADKAIAELEERIIEVVSDI